MSERLGVLLGQEINQRFIDEKLSPQARAYLSAMSGEFVPPYNVANGIWERHRLGGVNRISEGMGGLSVAIMTKGDWEPNSGSDGGYTGQYRPARWAPGVTAELKADDFGMPWLLRLIADDDDGNGQESIKFSSFDHCHGIKKGILLPGDLLLDIGQESDIQIARAAVAYHAMDFLTKVHQRQQ